MQSGSRIITYIAINMSINTLDGLVVPNFFQTIDKCLSEAKRISSLPICWGLELRDDFFGER
jgi:hypothetical protein